MRNPLGWLLVACAVAFLVGTALQIPLVHAPRLAAALEAR